MALSSMEIELLNNLNMIAQQEHLGEQINNAIIAGENGEVTKAIEAGDAKVKEELTQAISMGDSETLEQAKAADTALKQQITKLIEDKHKGILTLTKMKKHNHLDAGADAATIVTEINSLLDDLIKCGIMNNA